MSAFDFGFEEEEGLCEGGAIENPLYDLDAMRFELEGFELVELVEGVDVEGVEGVEVEEVERDLGVVLNDPSKAHALAASLALALASLLAVCI